ncbi:YigZ family protein [Massilibacterium senegalense]|uniref:YigZ family protein n=1 Tax=Massilibacterium senegalense TaxID=1632858 RepID=UPI0007865B2F|nr:YigZ family protein [Massilibacterium senegalense]
MLTSYYTVKPFGIHEINIQKSRFIAHIKRVETEEEAQSFISKIKKEHWNATHNCSCYMIGEHNQVQKANDDGEPAGTAGVPMLEVLKKRRLKNTAVVVTRYFGGVKLGVGGLIRAYSQVTSEGINATGIVRKDLMRTISTTIDYTLLGKVENELRHSHYKLKHIDYLANVTVHTYVKVDEEQNYVEWMTELTNGQGQITMNEVEYLEEEI